MNFIEFTTAERVGIASIDQQHIELTELVNEIHDAVLKYSKNVVISRLGEFSQSLAVHFETEESLMKSYRFEGFISHKLEHDRFFNQIRSTIDLYGKEEALFGLEQLKGIKRWFFNHLEINDKKCAKFLISKGVS